MEADSSIYFTPAASSASGTDTFVLGDSDGNVVLQIAESLSTSTFSSGSFSAQDIQLTLFNRNESSGSDIRGLNIEFDSATDGRLEEGDVAVGIQVDMSDLLGSNFNVNDQGDVTNEGGNKYSAVFSGGYVGVGTTAPEAGLHIVQEDSDDAILRLDSVTSNYRLFVDSVVLLALELILLMQLHVVSDINDVDSILL